MLPGELKPILAALALPPAAPLLLALVGALLVMARRMATGAALVLLGLGSLWLLACTAVATWLAQVLLPQHPPIAPQQLATVQAIVVLGGGIRDHAPEYGSAQPSAPTLGRLRYGARLARQSGKPLAFSGGIGWAAQSGTPPEAQVAAEVLAELGVQPRWADARSRDTAENALEMQRLLAPAGVRRIALVTDSWHMARAVGLFGRVGFDVVPAPTGFPSENRRAVLSWLPSTNGLVLSTAVLREWLALQVAGL